MEAAYTGFLNNNTDDILDPVSCGVCPVHPRIFSRISGVHPLTASCKPPFSSHDNKTGFVY